MKFILIRHAQSAPKRGQHQSEWGLTLAGEESCRQLADFLCTHNCRALYSSGELKAVQTAEAAASWLEVETSVVAGLEEQDNRGVGWFEAEEDFRNAVQKLFEQPKQAVFGAESAQAAAGRFESALAEIAKQHTPSDTVALVTHGRVMTAFLQMATEIDPIPFWRSLTFPAAVTISWPTVKLIGRRSF